MAKVKIQGHASGTGILTVTAPNTSTDRTITLPDATGTLATTADVFDPDGAVTINDTGADVDFRVEGNNETHALFIQGSEGRIGVNHSTPDARLEIHPASETGLQVTSSVAAETTAQFKGAGTGNVSVISCRDSSNTSVFDVKQDGRGLSQFTAKAWVNLNGTGTIAINDSHNVSSITDMSTGDYKINFSNNMANTDYSLAAAGGDIDDHVSWRNYGGNTDYTAVGMARIGSMNHAGTFYDRNGVSAIFFGD